MRTRRQYVHLPVTICKDTCESSAFDMREYDGKSLQALLPGTWTAAALAVKVSPVLNTTFRPLYVGTMNNTLMTTALVGCNSVAASKAYQLTGLGGAGFVRLWSHDGSEGDEDQAAERVVGVCFKG